MLVTAGFEAVARASAVARGLPELPIVVFPTDLDERDAGGVRLAWDERWAQVRAALMRC